MVIYARNTVTAVIFVDAVIAAAVKIFVALTVFVE